MKVKERMRKTVTPRQLIEQWTPGIFCDGGELACTLAIHSTVILIRNGAIPASRETRTFMDWYEDIYLPSIGGVTVRTSSTAGAKADQSNAAAKESRNG